MRAQTFSFPQSHPPPFRSFLAPAPITEECGRKEDGAGVELGGLERPPSCCFSPGEREGGRKEQIVVGGERG